MEKNVKPEQTNLETTSAHRKQFYVQILLPIIIGTLILLILGILAASGGNDRPTVWANISIIFMAIIIGLSGLVSLAVLVFSIFGTNWIINKLPAKSYLVQIYTVYYGQILINLADKLANPIVSTKSRWAGITSLFRNQKQSYKEE